MRVYTVLEDDVDTADVDDCEAETGRAIALAEYNYFTAVVLGYGVPADGQEVCAMGGATRHYVKELEHALRLCDSTTRQRAVQILTDCMNAQIIDWQQYANRFRVVLNVPHMPADRLPDIVAERLRHNAKEV